MYRSSLIVLVASCSLLGCQTMTSLVKPTPSAPYTPYKYTGTEQLWPAVFESTLKWARECEDQDINIMADVYRFERCPAQGSSRIRYDALIKKGDDTLTMDVSAEHYDTSTKTWKPGMPLLAAGDFEQFKSRTMAEIEAVMSDSSQYRESRATYYQDFYFHIYVMGFMTDVAKQEWIADLTEDKTIFKVELGLAEFKESPHVDFTYEAWLQLPTRSDLGYSLRSTKVKYYTNAKDLAYHKVGDAVLVSGSFLSYEDRSSTFSLTAELGE